jgi:hypothetical protein
MFFVDLKIMAAFLAKLQQSDHKLKRNESIDVYFYPSYFSPDSPFNPQCSLHCPKNKADFRENKGGIPLEGKFSSNPWK